MKEPNIETKEGQKSRRGRPSLPESERVINFGLCGKPAIIEFIRTWNDDPSKGLDEMIEDMKAYRPLGRFSPVAGGGKVAAAAKNAPGTRTTLKRELKIARLEKQLVEKQLEKAKLENAKLKEQLGN
jgi:hypothetical protein